MKILFATDGLPHSMEAAAVLNKLGDKRRIEVTVFSVTHTGIAAPEHLPLVIDPEPTRRKDTLDIVDATVTSLRDSGFQALGRVGEGHPGQEIVQAVERDWYDLVVVGGGTRSAMGARLFGSVSTYVLHSSPWSVLVAHDAVPGDARGNVLIGVDGSRSADLTVRTVLGFADRERVGINILSVVPDTSSRFLPVPGAAHLPRQPPPIDEDLYARLRDRAQRQVDSVIGRSRDAGFDTAGQILDGHATETLLKEAENNACDLVAIGSRGLGPFRRTLLGSVSDQVMRHARATLIGRRSMTS